MRPFGIIAATVIALSPLAGAAPQAAPLVSASHETEQAVMIPLINPHAPLSIDVDAQALAEDVNRERVKRGRAPLTRDASLDRLASAKAVDMAAHGYFGHT